MSGAAEVEEGSAALAAYANALAKAGAAAHLGPREQIGENLFGTFLAFWEDPELRPQLLGVFRSAAAGGPGAARMREFMSSEIYARTGETLNAAPMDMSQVAEALKVSPLQINGAVAQVMGVILLRYVLEVEPIASVPAEELKALIAPTIQRYMAG